MKLSNYKTKACGWCLAIIIWIFGMSLYAQSPVIYLPLNGDVSEVQSGFSTIQNGGFFTQGRCNGLEQALSMTFNTIVGVNRVTVGVNLVPQNPTTALGIFAWVYIPSSVVLSGNTYNVISKINGNNGYALKIENGRLRIEVGTSGSVQGFTGTASVPQDQWVFIGGTLQINGMLGFRTYVNNTINQDLTVISTNISNNGALLSIGGSNLHGFTGTIQEVRIYNTWLNNTTVQSLYENTKPITVSTMPDFNVCEGANSAITLTYTGGLSNVVWYSNNTSINGSNFSGMFHNFSTSSLGITLANTSPDNTTFRAVLSNPSCTVTTNGFNFDVIRYISNPAIVTTPTTTCVGTTFSISATTTTGDISSLQWKRNGIALNPSDPNLDSPINSLTLSINNAVSTMTGVYRVQLQNACMTVTSNGYNFTVVGITSLVGITNTLHYCENGVAIANSTLAGGTSITYKWGYFSGSEFLPLVNGATVSGANSQSLTLTGLAAGLTNQYNLTATGLCGVDVKGVSVLQQTPNTFAINPPNIQLCQNSSGVLTTTVYGNNLEFVWLKDDAGGPVIFSPLDASLAPGGNTASNYNTINLTLNIANNISADGISFALSVTGSCGSYLTSTIPGSSSLLSIQSGPGSIVHPITTSVCPGGTALFTSNATGSNKEFRWQFSPNNITWTTITGMGSNPEYSGFFTTTTGALTITGVPSTLSGYFYRVHINTSCGSEYSNSAQLLLHNPVSITTQPISLLTTCLGTNTHARVVATGTTPITYQWQAFISGSWTNLANSAPYSNVATNQLEISQIPISLNGINLRAQATNLCGTQASTVSTVQINLLPYAELLGLDNSYCSNDPEAILTTYSEFTIPGGTFGISPPGAVLSNVSPGVAKINPAAYTNTATGQTFILTYQSLADQNGCRAQLARSFTIRPKPIILFTSPPTYSFAKGAGQVITVTALPQTPGIGMFEGNGIIGNLFYPDITPGFGNNRITYTFTNTLTGCKDSDYIDLNVFDANASIFTISPAGVDLRPDPINLPATFCPFDGNEYRLTYTGQKGSDAYPQFYWCQRDPGIRGSGITPVADEFYVGPPVSNPIIQYFRPTLAGVGFKQIEYMTSYVHNPTIPCSGTRTVYAWKTQVFEVKPRSPQPVVLNPSINFCAPLNPSISVSGTNIRWYNALSVEISSLAGRNVVSLREFGVNTISGSLTPLQVGVSQTEIQGCQSLIRMLNIYLYPKPPVPTLSGSNLYEICQLPTTRPTTFSVIPDGISSYYWYRAPNTLFAISPSVNVNINITSPQLLNYSVAGWRNGCLSNRVGFTFRVNENPPPPSQALNSQNCTSASPTFVQPLRASLTTTVGSPIRFLWLDSDPSLISGYITTFTSTGSLTTVSGGIGSEYTPPFTNASVLGLSYYVVTQNTVTGCINKSRLRANLNVHETPDTAEIIYTRSTPYCYHPSLFADAIQANGESGASISWYTNTPLGIVFTGSVFNPHIPLNTPSDNRFYVQQSLNGCSSAYARAYIKVQPPVSAPGVVLPVMVGTTAGTLCTGGVISNTAIVTTIGTNIRWYTSPTLTGSSLFKNGSNQFNVSLLPSIQTLNTGTFTYYVTQSLSLADGGCESMANTFTITVLSTPHAPLTIDYAACDHVNSPIIAAVSTLNGTTFRWFEDPRTQVFIGFGSTVSTTLGRFLNTLNTGQTLAGGEVLLRYVTQEKEGCISPISQVQFNVFDSPIAPISDSVFLGTPISDYAYCSGSQLRPFRLNTNVATMPNTEYLWYGNINYTNLRQTGPVFTQTVSNNVAWTDRNSLRDSVYAVTRDNIIATDRLVFEGCKSVPTKFTLKVKAIPPTPSTSSPISYCSGFSFSILTVSGVQDLSTAYSWYNDASLSTLQNIGPSYLPNNIIINVSNPTSYTYFVTQTYDLCTSLPASTTISYNPRPNPALSGVLSEYCEYEAPSTITGTPNIGILGTTFSGTNLNDSQALVQINNNIAVFNPQLAISPTADSKHEIKFKVTNTFGCVDSVSAITRVKKRPNPSFTGLEDQYCVSQSQPANLFASPSGGTFSIFPSGTGISGNQFFPNLSGVGQRIIQYLFTDAFSQCTTLIRDTTIVQPSPLSDFSITGFCETGNSVFTSLSTIQAPGSIKNKFWRLTDENLTLIYSTTGINAHYVFPRFGNYTMLMADTSDRGCVQVKTRTFYIGAYPKANLRWENICEGQETKLYSQIQLVPTPEDSLKSVIWQIENIGNASVHNPSVRFPKAGAYTVSLSGITTKNCIDTKDTVIHILPKIILSAENPYTESFDLNNGGWFSDGDLSTWAWGIINKSGFNNDVSDKGWGTGTSTHQSAPFEASNLNGPCFDFSLMQRPMISISMQYDTREKFDGAVLQYSTDDGVVWTPVGDLRTGLNWYNFANVLGDAGKQNTFQRFLTTNKRSQLAWSGKSGASGTGSQFVVAEQILDEIQKNSNVRLRIAFGSASDTSETKRYKGIAIHNVAIQERAKFSLLEMFGNAGDKTSNEAMSEMEQIAAKNALDIIGLQYNTSFPVSNVFNTFNPEDPSARVLYYGLQSVPRVVFDGNVYNGLTEGFNPGIIALRALAQPIIDIYTDFTITNNTFETRITTYNHSALGADDYVLHAVVVERSVSGVVGLGGKNSFDYIVRKMLPDASGFKINQTEAGQSDNYTFTYEIPTDVIKKEHIGLVVFVQNRRTKSVVQTAYVGAGAAISVPNQLQDEKSISITVFPNPSQGVTLLKSHASKIQTVRVLDLLGNPVPVETLQVDQGIQIELKHKKTGVYFIQTWVNGVPVIRKWTVD